MEPSKPVCALSGGNDIGMCRGSGSTNPSDLRRARKTTGGDDSVCFRTPILLSFSSLFHFSASVSA